jgi:hypothetical protein
LVGDKVMMPADLQRLHKYTPIRRTRSACCARTASGHAAEKRGELTPPHSITSSAVDRSDGGTVRPSSLAVW